VIARTQDIPPVDKLEPTKCYVYWEIILATPKDINDVSDVFLFVEDESKLEIHKLRNYNLLEDEQFIARLKQLENTDQDIGINAIEDIMRELGKEQEGKHDFHLNGNNGMDHRDTTISSIRVASDKLDTLMNLVSEMVTTQARLSLFAEKQQLPGLEAISESVQKLTRQLRDNAFSIVLIPIETIMTRFQRLVRDLSDQLNKKVVLPPKGLTPSLIKPL
jgi:two-component system, chemotaxis family, sensor kinase CheA